MAKEQDHPSNKSRIVEIMQGPNREKVFLAADEKVCDYLIEYVILRYTADPKDRIGTSKETFIADARQRNVCQANGTFDYRLYGLNEALYDDEATSFDDVVHSLGRMLVHTIHSADVAKTIVPTMRAVAEGRRDTVPVLDFKNNKTLQQKVTVADQRAASTILMLVEPLNYFPEGTTTTRKSTTPLLIPIIETFQELAQNGTLPTPEMFTQSELTYKRPPSTPATLYKKYIASDLPLINFDAQHPIIQRGFLGTLFVEISKHSPVRNTEHIQLQAIAEHLFEYQNEYAIDARTRQATRRHVPPIDCREIRNRLIVLLDSSHNRTFDQQDLNELVHDLMDNREYGLNECPRLIQAKRYTPEQLLKKYNPKSGQWRDYSRLDNLTQRQYCAQLIQDMIPHIHGRHTQTPRLEEQLLAISAHLIPQAGQRSPNIETIAIRNMLMQLLENSQGEEILSVQSVTDLTYQLLETAELGLAGCPKLLPSRESLRKLPNNVASALKPERVKIDDRTVAKSPRAILDEYDTSIKDIAELKKFERYGVAHGMLVEIRKHLASGHSGQAKLVKQYEMWIEELRQLAQDSKQSGNHLFEAVNRSLKGLDRINPIVITETVESFLNEKAGQKTLTANDIIELATALIQDDNNGLNPFIETHVKALEGSKQVVRKAGESAEWTKAGCLGAGIKALRVLNAPVYFWDKAFEKMPFEWPAVRRTGKYSLYAAEAIYLTKGITEVTNLGFLRKLDNSLQAFHIAAAQTIAENEWLKGPAPLLRNWVYQDIPWVLSQLKILNNEQVTEWQNRLSSIDMSSISQAIASSPHLMYATSALAFGVLWRAGHGLVTKIGGHHIPYEEKDFNHYFGRGLYNAASAYMMYIPNFALWVWSKIDRGGVVQKINDWRKNVSILGSVNHER